jgi:diguanylate cyclase (GGDEF)-like protein
MVEATRWLFWLLAVISLVLSSPAAVLMPVGILTLGAVLSLVGLAASITRGYLTRRASWAYDLVDAAGIVGLGIAAPNPSMVFALVFALIWFRSLYGSTVHGLLRCVIYGSAVVVTFVMVSAGLGPDLGGAATSLGAALPVALAAVPTMFVTVVAGRHLAGLLMDREQEARRDAVHAATGSQLLGVTDPTEIRDIVWQAVTEVCRVTPELRVLGTRELPDGLEVVGHSGGFLRLPTSFSTRLRSDLERYDADGPPGRGLAELDDAVGRACEWRCLPLVDQSGSDWLVLASPRRIPVQAVATLTTLVTQGTLAMRNSHAHQQLTAAATQDSLTGLANRSLFNAELSRTLSGARGSETAVLFVDLDDFKDVNDVFGHAAGDDVLREVAGRITAATRTGDVCARLGGDEFAVLLPRTGADTATLVGRRIVASVAGPLPLRGTGVAQVGASVGLAVDTDGSTAAEMVQRADIAMYAAKASGKGRVQEFSTSLLQGDAGRVDFGRRPLAATADLELVVASAPAATRR